MTRLAAAVAVYRRLGWSPGHTDEFVWLRAGNVVDALELPRELGERVPAEGPLFAIADAARPRWVFLTRPARRSVAQLAAYDVEHITAGGIVDLPPSRFGPTRLHWLIPFVAVADAIIRTATLR